MSIRGCEFFGTYEAVSRAIKGILPCPCVLGLIVLSSSRQMLENPEPQVQEEKISRSGLAELLAPGKTKWVHNLRLRGKSTTGKRSTDMNGMHYEGFCIRPPSEAKSILLQVTVGCSHNKCTFCGSYKEKRFRIKDEETIFQDIRWAARNLRDRDRLFLMDGDALIIPQERLVRIMDAINENMPWLQRIGLYANAKSIRKKTPEQLRELAEKKLGIVYLGLESGDDRVLEAVNKGSTAGQFIEAGQKVRQAGIQLSVTVLLGIAGTQGSLEHARATGKVLTEMDPEYVGALTVMLVPGTPLYQKAEQGEFRLPDQAGILRELREMLAHTELSRGLFTSNHASNYLPLKVRIPGDKEVALDQIDRALKGEVGLKPEWMRAL